MKRIIFISLLCFFSLIEGASQEKDNSIHDVFVKYKLSDIAMSHYDNGWVEFNPELNIDPEKIFEDYKQYFGLGKNDKMKLEKINVEENGMEHYRYQQYYKNIKVEGMQYFIHAKNGIAISANGHFVSSLEIDVKTSIKKKNALDILNSKNNVKYKSNEDFLEEIDECDLIIAKNSNDGSIINNNFILMGTLDVMDDKGEIFQVKINLCDLTKHKIQSKKRYTNLPDREGTCNTLFNGTQSVLSYYHNASFSDFTLFCFESYYTFSSMIYTTNGAYWVNTGTEGSCNYPIVRNSTNSWTSLAERRAGSAMWAFQKTRSYFLNTFNHKGIDGSDSRTQILLSSDFDEPNAYFNPDSLKLVFCSKTFPDKSNEVLSLDIVAHEFTHGIIHYYTGGLSYSGETGAIEEGLADIFGAIVQSNIEGYNQFRTYTIGEDVFYNNKDRRSLSDPKSMGGHSINSNCTSWDIGQPNTYMGQYWDTRGCDESGVHINSTVMSHWFYRLAEGGSGYNDDGDFFNVQGIGRDKAARIAFSFMRNYLNYGSNFSDARNGTLMAASYLFGACSNEFLQVSKAWEAVGVISSYSVEHNITNPCNRVYLIHLLNLPYKGYALDEILFNCNISQGKITELAAVNSVKFTSGFKVSNPQKFTAKNISCIDFNPILKSNQFVFENEIVSVIDNNMEASSKVIIYPNPSNGLLHIVNQSEESICRIEIFDSNGQMAMVFEPYANIAELDLYNLKNGLYLAFVYISNERDVIKFTIEK